MKKDSALMWGFYIFILLFIYNLVVGKFYLSLIFLGCALIDLSIASMKKSNSTNKHSIEETDINIPNKDKAEVKIDNLIKKSIAITGPTPPANPKKVTKKKSDYTKARKLVDDYIIIDFETTGLNPSDSEIIQIGAIKYKSNKEVARVYQNIKPVRSNISKKITEITGLEAGDVLEMPTFKDFSPQLMSFIDSYTLVAHNAPFDLKFLLHQLNENNIALNYRLRVIDTLPLARKYFKTPNHKLITLKDYLGLNNTSHDALEDCLVTNEVYQYIKNESIKLVN